VAVKLRATNYCVDANGQKAVCHTLSGRIQGGFIPSKLPKLDLATDAEYVANLRKCQYVIVNVQQCSLLHAYMLYLHNDSFLTDIIGCDRLKFS